MAYPTFSEIEDDLGELTDDPVYDRLNLRIDRIDENDDSDGSERPVLREDGSTVEDADEIAEIIADAIADEIRRWDCENIADIQALIARMGAVGKMNESMGAYVRHITDSLYTDLPCAPEYEARVMAISFYPIWTCDAQGECLTGGALDDVMHIDDIEESHRRPGA